MNNRRNVWILHLCQKFSQLHLYIFHLGNMTSPTLKLSKNFHFTGVEDSPFTGCSATKFEHQSIFERCFENVRKCFMKSCAIKFLFSKLQSHSKMLLSLALLMEGISLILTSEVLALKVYFVMLHWILIGLL